MNTTLCPGSQTSASNFSLNLHRQAMFSVPDAANVRIGCAEGSVWITLDNDQRDLVLDACDVFTTTEHRRALVYALKPSRITVSAVKSESKRSQALGLTLEMAPA